MLALKISILLYHSVSADGSRDDLTVSKDQLEGHFQYLRSKGYSAIGLSELIAYHRDKTPLPPKPVLITFDDGFKNSIDIAYPLAKALGIKINLFLVPGFMLRGEYRNLPCLGAREINQMDAAFVEVGLHSFTHQRYAEMSPAQAGADIDLCKRYMEGAGIRYQPCLAYPYGAYPLNKGDLQTEMFDILAKNGIQLAFGIGNHLNGLPLRNRFTIQRCEIKGGESFRKFKRRLALGGRSLNPERAIWQPERLKHRTA
jgi:peptidoglycan/xylan/chitin deacetylase (PgdA/CDA1 family)